MKKILLFLLILVFASLSFVSCDDESESTKTLEEKMEGVWEWIDTETETEIFVPAVEYDLYGKYTQFSKGKRREYSFDSLKNNLYYCIDDDATYTVDEKTKIYSFINADGEIKFANVSFDDNYMILDYSESNGNKWITKMKKVDPSVIDAAYEYCD
ncbi:MAG TPA: hypothetical protein P5123_04215 [Spirochaetota bacterium]|nr:hypothetical protein [Spirochaetota bacterium]